jgi:hypothetical protein
MVQGSGFKDSAPPLRAEAVSWIGKETDEHRTLKWMFDVRRSMFDVQFFHR